MGESGAVFDVGLDIGESDGSKFAGHAYAERVELFALQSVEEIVCWIRQRDNWTDMLLYFAYYWHLLYLGSDVRCLPGFFGVVGEDEAVSGLEGKLLYWLNNGKARSK